MEEVAKLILIPIVRLDGEIRQGLLQGRRVILGFPYHTRKGGVRKPHRLELERPRGMKFPIVLKTKFYWVVVRMHLLKVKNNNFWEHCISFSIHKNSINPLLNQMMKRSAIGPSVEDPRNQYRSFCKYPSTFEIKGLYLY